MYPVHLGTAEEFALVRNFLQQADYSLESICRRMRLTLPYDFTRLHPGPADQDPAEPLELLIRVLLLGEAVSLAQAREKIPVPVLQAMTSLGLLQCLSGRAESLYSPVAVCAVGGLWFVSDRWSTPDGSPVQLPTDAVYPAMTFNTQVFLGSLCERKAERVLDLCAGTGVAAMLAARNSGHVWSSDVAPRCSHFAEFNRRLNDLENVTVATGDLYAAVDGGKFDRILAHPPYVPVLKPKYVYHDGGSDGEEITRRIIEGLPTHLASGGAFQCHTMATDRDVALEGRIRQWLGAAQAEFDVLIVITRQLDPANFAAEVALKNGNTREFDTWKELFTSWQVKTMLDVCITIERHAEARPALTLRRSGPVKAGGGEAQWLLRWDRIAGKPEAHDALLRACPVISPHLQLAMVHRVEEGTLVIAECKAAVSYPYNVDAAVEPWMASLFAACDGRTTGMQLFERMRQERHIPEDTPPLKFGALLAAFISRGFVYVEDFAPPGLE